ncbi:substrate-binding domain-containing protein [Thalassolituus sp.]|uniref:substrate-binding domain-containing protein n=1 Tax=Thalassolituus sp. TaxID=2030822 RepID=UPI0035163CD2
MRSLILLVFFLIPLAFSSGVSALDRSLFSDIPSGRYQHLFRIDGSNTIGAEMAPALAEAWLTRHGASQLNRVPLAENEVRITGYLDSIGSHVIVDIAAHGSGTGFSALAKGLTDIAAASRPVKPKEASQITRADLTTSDSEHIVGIDGLAIIVDPTNPVNALSVESLRAIFSGQITNWSELDGADVPVSIFARDEKSGTWDSFKHMVLGKTPLADGALRFESNNALSDRVSGVRGAIGFVGLPAVRQSKLIAVSAGDVAALAPDRLTVATEDYALSRRLYMYTAGVPENRYVKDFLAFVASEGQQQVAETGFISQDVAAVRPDNVASLPDTIRSRLDGAYRLSVNFRFNESSARLDNKAQRDVDRLLTYLKKHPDAEVMLFGYASESDDLNRAQLLSKHRAMAVSRALKQADFYANEVDGFGAEAPLARIEGNDGRQKNSRVEVWLRAPQAIAEAL